MNSGEQRRRRPIAVPPDRAYTSRYRAYVLSTFRSFSILAKLIIISVSLSLSLSRATKSVRSKRNDLRYIGREDGIVCEKSAHDNKIFLFKLQLSELHSNWNWIDWRTIRFCSNILLKFGS